MATESGPVEQLENNFENNYFRSLVDPTRTLVGIPDSGVQLCALKKLALSTTFTVPDEVEGARLLFLWIPRGRSVEIAVYVWDAAQAKWGVLTYIPYELDPVASYRLIRLVSGILTIQGGTVATTLAPLSGFVDAVQCSALPNLLGIAAPNQLFAARRTQFSQYVQGRLADGFVALAAPDALSGFVQPDNLHTLVDWTDATPLDPLPNNPSYYRVGQYTVGQTDEEVAVVIGAMDAGWVTTNYVSGINAGTIESNVIFDTALSTTEFPVCVLGELDFKYAFNMRMTSGGASDCCFVLTFFVTVPRAKPTDWSVDEVEEPVTRAFSVNFPGAGGGEYSDQLLTGQFRYRPGGLVKRIRVTCAAATSMGPVTNLRLAAFSAEYTNDNSPMCIVNELQIRMRDMTTFGGFNSPNTVAIVSGLVPAQVVQVSSIVNLEVVPNEVLAPNLKTALTHPRLEDVTMARTVFSSSPVFCGLYSLMDYRAVLNHVNRGNLTNLRIAKELTGALDWGDIWHGIKSVAGAVGPIAGSLVGMLNPTAGSVISGISDVLSKADDAPVKKQVQKPRVLEYARDSGPLARDSGPLARDSSPLARDSRPLARDSVALARDRKRGPRVRGGGAHAADRFPFPLGTAQRFLSVTEGGEDGEDEVLVWNMAVHLVASCPEGLTTLSAGWSDTDGHWIDATLTFEVPIEISECEDVFAATRLVLHERHKSAPKGDGPAAYHVYVKMSAPAHVEGVYGHSWHAAYLASLLRMPPALWTGSPIVPAGGLRDKIFAAISVGQRLNVVGDVFSGVLDVLKEVRELLPSGRQLSALLAGEKGGEDADVLVLPASWFGSCSEICTDNDSLRNGSLSLWVRELRILFGMASVRPRGLRSNPIPTQIQCPHMGSGGELTWRAEPVRSAWNSWRVSLADNAFKQICDRTPEGKRASHVLRVMLANFRSPNAPGVHQILGNLSQQIQHQVYVSTPAPTQGKREQKTKPIFRGTSDSKTPTPK